MQRLVTKNLMGVILIALFWTILGRFSSGVAMIGVVATITMLIAVGNFQLLTLSFYTLLVFSDSYESMFAFAPTIKPVAALVFGAMGYLIMRKYGIQHPFIKMFLFFIVVAGVTIFLAEQYFTIFMKSLSYVLIMLASPILLIYSIRKSGITFLREYFFLVFLIMMVGFFAKYVSYDFAHLNDRYRGMFGNPNGLGLFVVINYLFYQVVRRKFLGVFSRFENWAILFAFFYSLYLCQSRTSLMVILIFHAFLFVNKRSPVLSFVFLLGAGFGYTFIISNTLWLIQVFGLEGYMRIETLQEGSGRYIAWNFIWEEIKRGSIIFGHGIGGTEHLFKINYKMLADMGHQGHAHNSYLTMWYDVGLLGLLAYFTGLLRSFFISRKDPVIFPVIIGVLISNNFESWITASLNPYTIVLFMMLTVLIIGDITIPKPGEEQIDKENQVDLARI